jgi:phosphatidylserine decarboxylase
MRNNHSPIAHEGFPFIAGFAAVAIGSALLAGVLCSWLLYAVAIPFVLLTLFSMYFFRDPERSALCDENTVISPADGQVILLERVSESPLGGRALKISIFMSVFNVHINRIPIAGKIVDITYFPGKFFDARHDSASFENERNIVVLETASGVRIAVVQIAGLIARRIVCYPVAGDVVQRGVRYGMIRFGSRLDVYLPEDVQPLVKLGDRMFGGVTPLGRIG